MNIYANYCITFSFFVLVISEPCHSMDPFKSDQGSIRDEHIQFSIQETAPPSEGSGLELFEPTGTTPSTAPSLPANHSADSSLRENGSVSTQTSQTITSDYGEGVYRYRLDAELRQQPNSRRDSWIWDTCSITQSEAEAINEAEKKIENWRQVCRELTSPESVQNILGAASLDEQDLETELFNEGSSFALNNLTYLQVAIEENNPAIIRTLIQHFITRFFDTSYILARVDRLLTTPEGRGAEATTIDCDNPFILEILLEYRAWVRSRDPQRNAAFQIASYDVDRIINSSQNINLIAVLIRQGVDIHGPLDKAEPRSGGILHRALVAFSGQPNDQYELIFYLLNNAIDINATDNFGQTGLLIAVTMGLYNITELLLGNGANTDIPNDEGFTPLHIAASIGNIEITALLLTSGANPNISNNNGRSPLDIAAQMANPTLIILLRAFDATPFNGSGVNISLDFLALAWQEENQFNMSWGNTHTLNESALWEQLSGQDIQSNSARSLISQMITTRALSLTYEEVPFSAEYAFYHQQLPERLAQLYTERQTMNIHQRHELEKSYAETRRQQKKTQRKLNEIEKKFRMLENHRNTREVERQELEKSIRNTTLEEHKKIIKKMKKNEEKHQRLEVPQQRLEQERRSLMQENLELEERIIQIRSQQQALEEVHSRQASEEEWQQQEFRLQLEAEARNQELTIRRQRLDQRRYTLEGVDNTQPHTQEATIPPNRRSDEEVEDVLCQAGNSINHGLPYQEDSDCDDNLSVESSATASSIINEADTDQPNPDWDDETEEKSDSGECYDFADTYDEELGDRVLNQRRRKCRKRDHDSASSW